MEFVFKPEKLTEDLSYQISEAIGKRSEIFSREKYPGMWKKVDKLNGKKAPEKVFRRRKIRQVIYGIILIALGIFLFVPGIMKPKELAVPLIIGAFSIINGIFTVIPRKANSEKFLKKAKKLISAINSSIKQEDTVVFNEEGIFENGSLLMEYENLESIIENRNIFFVCGGEKIMILRKADMVVGNQDGFRQFVEEKTKNKTCSYN